MYESAPEGTMAAELPEQMVALLTLTIGVVLTDTVATAILEIQPSVEPVTE